MSDSESVCGSDGSNRSDWVRSITLLPSIVTVGYTTVEPPQHSVAFILILLVIGTVNLLIG